WPGCAVPRRARARRRGDELGHPPRGRDPLPAAGRPLRGAPRDRALRPHRAARARRWPDPRPDRHTVSPPAEIVWLDHSAIRLALHPVQTASDGPAVPPLLLLHGLGESAAVRHPATTTWPGAVWALDFAGHGHSAMPSGGGYTAEVLMGDTDIALAHLG